MSFQSEAFENLVEHRLKLTNFYVSGGTYETLEDPETSSDVDEKITAKALHEELTKDGGVPPKVELEAERANLLMAMGNAFHRRSGANQDRVSRMAHFASVERQSAKSGGVLTNIIKDVGDFNVNDHSKQSKP